MEPTAVHNHARRIPACRRAMQDHTSAMSKESPRSASSAMQPRASCLSVSRPRIPHGNASGPHSSIIRGPQGITREEDGEAEGKVKLHASAQCCTDGPSEKEATCPAPRSAAAAALAPCLFGPLSITLSLPLERAPHGQSTSTAAAAATSLASLFFCQRG